MHDVFISYSHKDIKIVQTICGELESIGIRCWYAQRNIKSGEVWADTIIEAIRKAKIFIVVFSENSNNSTHVISEISNAIENQCTIIPFRVDHTKMNDRMSYYLLPLHWFDATGNNVDQSARRLRNRVETILKENVSLPIENGVDPFGNVIIQSSPENLQVPASKKKKRFGFGAKHWVILAVAAVVAAVLMFGAYLAYDYFYVQDLMDDFYQNQNQNSNSGGESSGADKAEPYVCVVKYFKSDYPFLQDLGLTVDGKLIVLKDDNGLYKLVKTDTGQMIADNIEYTCLDDRFVIIIGTATSRYLYFVNILQDTVSVYDRDITAFVEEATDVPLELKDTEWIAAYASDTLHVGENSDKFTKFQLILYDVDMAAYSGLWDVSFDEQTKALSYEKKDISEYELTTLLANHEVDGESTGNVFALDKQNQIRILNLTSGTLLDVTHEELCNDYLPYAAGEFDGSALSDDGRFLMRRFDRTNERNYQIWNTQTNTLVFNEVFVQECNIFFLDNESIVYYSVDESKIICYNLNTQKRTTLFNEAYFESNAKFFADIPFDFWYIDRLDIFVFGIMQQSENGEENKITFVIVDRKGDIIAYSYAANVDFSDCSLYCNTKDDLILCYATSSTDYLSEVFIIKYEIDENNQVVFEKY